MNDGLGKLAGGTLAALIVGGSLVLAIRQDRYERALLAAGDCALILEALYTPPPRAHTSCHGDGTSQSCSTWYIQPDPYMRSLWRCPDPKRAGAQVEFWRRSAERGTW